MNDDMSQFLGVFLDEANEQLERLESDILELESAASPELLQGIFRAAHTLKGSSRAMGFTSMGELTHAMEDVFDALRNDALSVDRNLIDALFIALDALKVMKTEVADSGMTTLDTTVQTARLRDVLGGKKEEEGSSASIAPPSNSQPQSGAPELAFVTQLSATEAEAVQAAHDAQYTVFGMKVRVSADCIMKSVRAMLALQALEEVGAVLATTPNEEGLENETFEDEFEVVFATGQGSEAAHKAVSRVTEISEVRIAPWPGSPGAGSPAGSGTPATPQPDHHASPVTVAEVTGTPEPPRDIEPAPVLANTTETATKTTPVQKPAPAQEERVVDAGPAARGKSPEEVQKSAGGAKNAQAQTVRVDVARLDKLLNLVGELVIDRTRLAQLGGILAQSYEASPSVDSLLETATHIGRITDELQEEIMKARMLPIDSVFNRFPRMMRDLAQKLGKDINFIIEGKETELDRSVLESLGDPLIHMLRNSVDHGLELPDVRESAGKPRVGNVWLRARHEENHIVIEIQDDGKGMDAEKLKASAIGKGLITPEAAQRMSEEEALNLIFASGFSTASVISDVSGRGVGMDIVRSNLQKVGARITIESKPGQGSTFRIQLPLTLAIIRGLLVTVAGCVYALPLSAVVETLLVAPSELHTVNGREVIWQRDRTLPLVRLRELFDIRAGQTPAEARLAREGGEQSHEDAEEEAENRERASRNEAFYVVIVGLADRQIGLVVDTLLGEQEVVIKSLSKFIGDIRGISGATILGDGRVALIMDINGVLQIATEEKGEKEKVHAV